MATRDYYQGVVIQYKGDDSNLSAVLGKMNTEMRQSQGAARALDAALKLDPKSLALVEDRAKVLEKQIAIVEERAKVLNSALENVKAPEWRSDIENKLKAAKKEADALRATMAKSVELGLDEEAKEAAEQLQKLEQQAANLQRQLDGQPQLLDRLNQQSDIAEARLKSLNEQLVRLRVSEAMNSDSGLGRFAADAQRLGSALKDAGESITGTGDRLTVGLTAPIVAFTAASVGAATTVDSALTDVRKTADATEGEYQALKEAAIEYSKTNAVTAEQILQVQALGAQLGYAADELEMVGRVGSGLDIATDMNAEQATTDMAQFANIVGMSHDKTENYASTVVALGNTMATTESKISGMAQSVAAAGSQVGMSEAEILGLAAALSSMGLEADGGGSNISKVMSQIDKDVATSSMNVQTWAAVAGMSADEFSERWRSRPVEALQAVFSGMGAAVDAGGNLSVILEALGIKSSQATDVAKRLANGHELLGRAIQTANEAWRENTALTEEVANRNGSLESKMQMLQNRVTALMEKVGKPVADALLSLVDAATPLIEDIESGAKAFSEMDASEQRALVSTVATVAAFGPMLSVTGRLVSGLGGMVTGMGNAAQGVIGFAQAMRAGFTATEALEFASEGLGATLSDGLLGAGIVAAIALVGKLLADLKQWADHVNMVHDATLGLSKAVVAGNAALEGYGEAAVKSASSAKDAVSEADKALRSVADFAGTIKETLAGVGDSFSSVDQYSATIKKLGNQGSITSGDLAVLRTAVEQYNETTGATVEITDESTGALNLLGSQIDEVTEAYRRQAEQEAYIELYNDAIKEQAKVERELKSVTSELDAMTAKYGVSLGDAGTLMLWNVNEARDLESRQKELSDSSRSLGENIDYWKSMMDSTPATFATLGAAMTSAGVTGEQYRSLTAAQLQQLEEAFDGTVASIAAKLSEFGVSVKGAGEVAVKSAGEASDAALQNAGQTANSLLSLQSSTSDQAYKAQQRAYQREERAQSSANTKAVSEMRKAHQQMQKELRASLDAEYDLRAERLAAETKQVQEANSAALAEKRKANGKALDELRASLDAEYDLRSNALADEVKDREAANKKLLASTKRQQEQATETYRKETKKRLVEMESEYKASVKLIESKYGIDSIDAEIKSLQDQTKAERSEQRKREQQEKESELRKAVDMAKSRRSRAEAEKELADYLAQIAHEQREEDREARIEELEHRKDELEQQASDKKEALQRQYEDEKARYEENRAAELERKQEAYQEDYEKLSESLSNALELQRKKNSEKLEDLKSNHQSIVDQRSEEYAQDEQELSDYLDGILERRRKAASAELDDMKSRHQSVIDQRAEEYSDEETKLRESLDQQLQDMRNHNQDALDELKSSGSVGLTALGDVAGKAESRVEATATNVAQKIDKGAFAATSSLVERIQEASTLVRRPAEGVASAALDSLNPLRHKVPKVAEDAASGFNDQLRDKGQQTRTVAEQLNDSAWGPVSKLPGSYREAGERATGGLASGISQGQYQVENAARQVAYAQEQANKSGESGMWGWDLVTNLANGIWDNIPFVSDAARAVGDVIDAFLGHSIAKEGPLHEGGRGEAVWGADLVDNIVGGMRSREWDLAAQSERLASIVEASFAPSLATRYDATLSLAQATQMPASWAASSRARPTEINLEAHFHMEGMSMSNVTDIRAASRMLAAETVREINAKLGD